MQKMNRPVLLSYLCLGLNITTWNILAAVIIGYDNASGYRENLLDVRCRGWRLFKVDSKLKDVELCLAAVMNDGNSLCFVPKRLRIHTICIAAVRQNAFSLRYVPADLITYEICEAAVQQNGFAVQYVPKMLLTVELCFIAALGTRDALWYVPHEFKEKVLKMMGD